jgi:hypothetical protein
MSKNSIAYNKAYQFAIRVVNAYKYLTNDKNEYVLTVTNEQSPVTSC